MALRAAAGAFSKTIKTMNIRIFNPEHEMALASGLQQFTPPHAGRDLRHDLGFLPAIWADDDDLILVDDTEAALEAARHLPFALHGTMVDHKQLRQILSGRNLFEPLHVDPWGWDLVVAHTLEKLGIGDNRMPDITHLLSIRHLASREWAAVKMLPDFRKVRGTLGEAYRLTTLHEVQRAISRLGRAVLKAPWSCSGRGIRYVESGQLSPSLTGWVLNVVRRQGCIMIEPYYNKVADFGMEFDIDAWGHVTYLGLSLFHTANGAYTGNIVDSEENKLDMLTRYVPATILKSVKLKAMKLLAEKVSDKYHGPLGIDMMAVRVSDDKAHECRVHPCVEVNFRHTMGHVALELQKRLPARKYVMRVAYTNKYRLQVEPLLVGVDVDDKSNDGGSQQAQNGE